MAKATKRKGREVGPETLAVRDLLDQHGDMSYLVALPFINKLPKAIKDHFTEVTEAGYKSGANRYNVAKNTWKQMKGIKVKARPKKDKAKTTAKSAPKPKTTRSAPSFDPNVLVEVARLGGIQAVKNEIARLQSLVDAASTVLGKVA